ncbi:MAG: 3,4-dihydroxy-2-butanone-4-phosphate synthase [Deltaproteobacteria bacterium]|nr:3,4-dihydroxy-2-butanone-4-phosphate synthase [Deltaproteobacteria bacterium]
MSSFENVKAAVADIAAGKMVVLVDDEDRENEGDLCLAAEKVSPEIINFMATHARGLICLTLTEAQTRRLALPMMVEANTSAFQTGFTVSIEAREGVTTGISAADRARTIQVAINPEASPTDLVRPGHVFPIRAREGGVLVRAGQTEGSVDLAVLAGLNPAGVICEIMNDDGSMARRPELERFAKKHGLRILTIAELIEHRLAHESLVRVVAERQVSTPDWGELRAMVFRSIVDGQEHLALVKGAIRAEEPALIRVQSIDLPADVVGLALSGGGAELRAAMRLINSAGAGVFIYLIRTSANARLSDRLDGRGGEGAPARYTRVGRRLDLREFGIGAQILKAVGVRKFRLMSNREVRIVGLEGFDLELVERIPLPVEPSVAQERGA